MAHINLSKYAISPGVKSLLHGVVVEHENQMTVLEARKATAIAKISAARQELAILRSELTAANRDYTEAKDAAAELLSTLPLA